MARIADDLLLRLIRDFLTVYMPSQRNNSAHTIRSYRTSLNLLLDYMKEQRNVALPHIKFSMITGAVFADFLDWLETEKGCGAATRNQRRAGIMAFYKYAAAMDVTVAANWLELKNVPKKNSESALVDYMSEAAVQTLMQQPDTATKKGIRNQFLMILLYDTAARIQEIVDLDVKSIRLGKTPTATLHGKRSKVRVVPLMEETVQHFHNYMRVFHNDENVYSDSPLFYMLRNGAKTPITTEAVRKILKSYVAKAQKTCADVPDNIHPHLWRHSRAMHLYQHGMDISLLSQWLGHTKIKTTHIYARADTEMKRKAIEKYTGSQNPLTNGGLILPEWRNDEETLKKLYGLA